MALIPYDDVCAHSHRVLAPNTQDHEIIRTITALQACVASPTSVRWKDEKFPATGINPPGAVSDPARNTTNGLLEFSKSAINLIAGLTQLNHDWAQGSLLSPHVHLLNNAAPVADTGDTQVWKFEWEVVPIDSTWDGSTYSNSGSVEHIVLAEDEHVLLELGDFDMTDYTNSGVSICIPWRVSRLGDHANDNYDAVATLLELDMHYQMDGIGSREEYTK